MGTRDLCIELRLHSVGHLLAGLVAPRSPISNLHHGRSSLDSHSLQQTIQNPESRNPFRLVTHHLLLFLHHSSRLRKPTFILHRVSHSTTTTKQAQDAIRYAKKVTVAAFAGNPVAQRLPSSPPFRLQRLTHPRTPVPTSSTSVEESQTIASIRIIESYSNPSTSIIYLLLRHQKRLLCRETQEQWEECVREHATIVARAIWSRQV